MTTTLVLPGHIGDRIRDLASGQVESGAVLIVSLVRSPDGDIRLLARELHEVPESSYDMRAEDELLVRSDGYVPALRRADELGGVPIWLHTHPGDGSSPRPSRHDHIVDSQLSDLFRLRADSDFYGALIAGVAGRDLTFTGHLDDGTAKGEIDRLWIVGPRLALYSNDRATDVPVPSLFDRNVRAFGGAVQRVLGDLHVGIVGCGGTGSAVAEQLVRLGVRHLTLVDPDRLSESNITRVYGSTLSDVGRPKVDVVGDHQLDIAPNADVARVPAMLTLESTARRLVGSDVIFGCTDDNAGRMVLSRLATYLLTPVIDCGVLLSSDPNGRLNGIHGRVTVLHPGAACLICRGRVDVARASSELMTPEQRLRLVEEGYAPALAGVEPAVVTYTSTVAGIAVGELIERLTHYGDEPVPNEILLRLHDREMSTNLQSPNPRHYCDPASSKLGLGITEPFLDQVWPEE
jgi:hypothetical protein